MLVLALAPVFFVDSALRTLLQFFYLLALAEMWNLLAGFAGLVSIGQQAYIGIGAYSLLVFADHLGANFFLSIFLAAIVAGVLAIPTAALVFRLRGGYFSIGTWVVAEVYLLLIANTQSLGGGSGATITSAIGIDPTHPPLRHVLDRVGGRRRVGPRCLRVDPHPSGAGPAGRARP